jgi:hypothetical protein
VGATWNWNWNRQFSFGLVTGYTEATVGRWETEIQAGRNQLVHAGGRHAVLRLFPPIGDNRWFAEVGIGANYISPPTRRMANAFSTEFNFGDHAAFGRILGDHGRRRWHCASSTSPTAASTRRTPAKTSRSCATRTSSEQATPVQRFVTSQSRILARIAGVSWWPTS